MEVSPEEVLASLRRMGQLPPLNIQRRVHVATLQEPAVAEVRPTQVGSDPEMFVGAVHEAPPSWLACATIGATG